MANVKKKCKVVMLPTDEKSKLYLTHFGGEKLHYNNTPDNKEIDYQHLYFLSDEEIKEGDWCEDSRTIYQIKDKNHLLTVLNFGNAKKIIATTDKTLLCEQDRFLKGYKGELPQPSKQFIEKYIEEYNSGNIITEVMVEYEGGCENYKKGDCEKPCDNPFCRELLKINPEDNTITISKCKDSWSREERNEDVIKALLSNDLIHSREEALQWIEENL